MSKRLVRITAVHPEAHAVDCIEIETGTPVPGAVVVTSAVTGNTGLADLAAPGLDRNVFGLLEVVGGLPLITGFLPPRVSQMLFDELERRVDRHASDVYSTIDADGNLEVCHPSGTYYRIAVTPGHEDLTGQNHDQNWSIDRNVDKSVHVQLQVANQANGVVATFSIAPDGQVTMDTRGSMSIHADGAVTIDSGTSIALTAPRIDFN